jgi:uncharacterized protein YndB with AHSA1/START domain
MSRSVSKEVFIDAPPDVVWNALTDAEQLTRWFPVRATVEGGAGGSISLSWGEGAEGKAPISVWEPGRRFGWTESRGAVTLAVDFHLQPQGGGTVVRLVQSGFGDGADWDAEYHMVQGGWAYFMEHLRWYLERHRGTPRDLVTFRDLVTTPVQDTFAQLTRALGLGHPDAWSSIEAGAPYEARTTDGDLLSGTVVSVQRETGQMGLTIEGLGHAILFLEMEPHPDGCRAGFWLSTYGLSPAELAAARARFSRLYTAALAGASG